MSRRYEAMLKKTIKPRFENILRKPEEKCNTLYKQSQYINVHFLLL